MTKQTRRNHTPAFKEKVALAASQGQSDAVGGQEQGTLPLVWIGATATARTIIAATRMPRRLMARYYYGSRMTAHNRMGRRGRGRSGVDTEISCDGQGPRSYIHGMRVLLAFLAAVGLLLSPVAASAAARACLRHDGGGMVMLVDAPSAAMAMGHPCCDEDAGKPFQHDSTNYAQACAAICGVSAAVPQTVANLLLTANHARVKPAAASPLLAHDPPGLKRPPKHDT